MKLSRKQGSTISDTHYWMGRKNNVSFKITPIAGGFYIMCNHNKSDIILNTLWLPDNHPNKTFSTLENAKKFCENFIFVKYKKYCLGSDANKL